MRAVVSGILNCLYPSHCPSCGSATDNIRHAPFCNGCWSGIKRYSGPSCGICSAPFSSEEAALCSGCMKKPPAFSRAMSYALYDGTLATAINLYKFHKIRRLYRPLGKLLLGFDAAGIDAVVPVPLSLKGLRERGFNQSLLLARVVAGHNRKPLIMDRLIKDLDTHPQIGLSAKERAANLKGAFSVRGDFRDMSLLLVDDVMTTGATVSECSKQLLEAGAKKIVVLTLARASAL